MLGIEIDLLTGRYCATAYHDRDEAEWPPHPARLFSALVATWATAGEDPTERAALEWLETQAPPRVFAPEAFARTVAPVFVPVNDVQAVADPHKAREAVATAEAQLADARAAGDDKRLAKAQKALEKAEQKLRDQTAKNVAPVTKVSGADLGAAEKIFPEGRTRQPRSFPSVAPIEPRYVLTWDAAPPDGVRRALAALCSRLVRVGHSSTLVRAALSDPSAQPVTDTGDVLQPDPDGEVVLRVPGPGQLAALERAYALHQEVEPRVLPCRFVAYRQGTAEPATKVPRSWFGDQWIVLARRGGSRLTTLATVELAYAVRGALLRHADQPPPAILSGHQPDGTPQEQPHVALVPLPFVGSRYADGQILGVAIVLPRAATSEERRAVLRAVGAWESRARASAADDQTREADAPPLKLVMGRAGELSVQRLEAGRSDKSTLRPRTWARPSRRWATATPIALDRNPGDLGDRNPDRRRDAFLAAEQSIRLACTRIGLPEPVEVSASPSVALSGSDKPRRFSRYPRDPKKTQRVLVHARLLFAEPVAGPVLLGAGRYFGLGLCRPVDGPEEETP